MVAYTITNSAGSTIATINTSTTTGSTFPIELIGQGTSLYGAFIAQNLYRMVENFAKTTPPTNPIEGQFWYKKDTKVPHYYDGSSMIPLLTASSAGSGLFPMLAGAASINLAATGTTAIFQAPGTGIRYHPTMLALLPVGAITATSPASLNLGIDTDEDILETVIVGNMAANRHVVYNIEGTTRFATGTETIDLNVTSAAGGGTLIVKALLFGFVTT